MLVVDVKDKEAADEQVGRIFEIHVSVRNTARVVRQSKLVETRDCVESGQYV